MCTNYGQRHTHHKHMCDFIYIGRQVRAEKRNLCDACACTWSLISKLTTINHLTFRGWSHTRACRCILPARQASGCINKPTTHYMYSGIHRYIGRPHSPARFILLALSLYRYQYLDVALYYVLNMYSLTMLSYFVQAGLVRISACVRPQVATLR